MTVILINDTPPAIRGMLKRWFIEPRPNVFVGSINIRTISKTLQYIRRNGPGIGMLVISSEHSSQGFGIECFGDTSRRPTCLSGLRLVAESWAETRSTEII